MHRILATVIGMALLAAGCGSNASLENVTVAGDAENPTVENGKISVDQTVARVIETGDGEPIARDDVVSLHYLALNGRTGEEFDGTFATHTPVTTSLTTDIVLEGWIKGLEGVPVGSRVLVAVPPEDGLAQANEQFGLRSDDTLLFLFDVLRKQNCDDEAGAMPTIRFSGDEPTRFREPAEETEPEFVQCRVVEEGDGEPIAAGQQITTHYHGQVYPDGTVFDSSWERGEPAQFQIGVRQVIGCWDEGLVGRTVGSRVILVCPADSAYGDQGSGEDIAPGDTLVFVVDLIEAS